MVQICWPLIQLALPVVQLSVCKQCRSTWHEFHALPESLLRHNSPSPQVDHSNTCISTLFTADVLKRPLIPPPSLASLQCRFGHGIILCKIYT